MRKEAERIAKGLYNGTITAGSFDKKLTKLVANELRKAVVEGFGKDLNQMDYGTPDYKKLVQLEKNVYSFSGAKNYQELKSLSLALKDELGVQREFADFKKEALKIDNAYNGRFLKTEYDTAIGSGQMAAKWVDINEHKDIYPLLEFDAVVDGKTSTLCKGLDKTVLPVNHPFWKQYYPPNHFKCRSDVRQLSVGTVTQNIPTAEIPDMFKTNLAEDGLAFPAKHTYYIGCPQEVLKKAEMLRDNVYSQLPKTPLMKKNVHVASLADIKDLEQNITLSRRLAEHGEEVFIQPHSFTDKVKNPELKLGANQADFKVDKNKTTVEKFVRNSLNNANIQQAMPVLVINENRYNKNEIWRALRGELLETKRKKNIATVWLLLNKQLVKITREQIVKNINLLP
jgi:Phage Mu protein F like protein